MSAAPDLRVVNGPVKSATVLDPQDPYVGAKIFYGANFELDGFRTLVEQAGLFYEYTGTHYATLEDAAIRARLWAFAARASRWSKHGDLVPFQPTTTKINNLLDATRALSHLPASVQAPTWLDSNPTDPNPLEVISLGNGILHVPSRDLLPATPRLYTHYALNVAFQPEVSREPTEWLAFLNELWPNDPQSIAVLQEIMGYLLLPDTRHQKAFLLVGPKRSGKGTIGRIVTALLGSGNVAAPTLGSMAGPFGLQPLIGKLLALISDARLSSRADQAAIAERILTVSGEDTVTVERKHLPAWTGRLPTRFMILTNELPRLADASGALASRFVVLTLERSFYGMEDPGLTDRLLGELPYIFAWALDGWDRLTERGHFVQPDASADAIQEMEDLGSPITAFVRERCRVGPGCSVETSRLFEVWKAWCQEQGRDHTGTIQTFGRDLRAAVPGVRTSNPHRVAGGRVRYYEGIELRGAEW
jgi:putative DNA primase/helicase